MFFVFSKLLIIFIYPVTWIAAFLIAALIVKNEKLKRKLFVTGTALLLIFSNPFLLNRFARRWDVQSAPLKNTKPYSCAIVLGGFSSEDSNGNGFFNGAADRFIEGVKLLNTGKVSHILISSGNGNLFHDRFREANWVKTQLVLFKVPDSCILIENRSRNTLENAAFSKLVLNSRRLQPPYVLVTSAFHMRRSLGIFKKIGLKVIPYSCNYIAGANGVSLGGFIPSADALDTWNTYIKQVVGTIVNHLK